MKVFRGWAGALYQLENLEDDISVISFAPGEYFKLLLVHTT